MKERLLIKNESNRLKPEDIQKMLSDADKIQKKEKNLDRVVAKNRFEGTLATLKTQIEAGEGKVPPNVKSELQKVLQESEEWLRKNESAPEEVYAEKETQLMQALSKFAPAGQETATGEETQQEPKKSNVKIEEVD